ncbi:MAG: adenylosuccinate synthetase [Candidatus Woesearchaeota archaeon]
MAEDSFMEEQIRIFEGIKDTPFYPPLSHENDHDYIVSSIDDVLVPLIDENDVILVCGSYFGDEGKGKLTDAIGNNEFIGMILRMNSGENAGHTVWANGQKYVFHLTPSGIMAPEKTCMIGPECVMDPVNFFDKEVSSLIEADVDYGGRFFVGNVHVVGPHHKIMDFALSPQNSSTLMGMSYVHASKVMKRGLRLDHLFNGREESARILEKDIFAYEAMLRHSGRSEKDILMDLEDFSKVRSIPDHLFEFLEAKDKKTYTLDLYSRKVVDNDDFPMRTDVNHKLNDGLAEGKKALIESPQSFWLSNATENHWPSSTSAQTHAAGVLAATRINPAKYNIAVVNIAKTPADSRVGIGSNPSSFVPQDYFSMKGIQSLDDSKISGACIDFAAIQKQYFSSVQENGILEPIIYRDSTGEYSISEAMAIASSRQFGERGATTGKPRCVGMFDCVAAAKVNEAQGPYLSISAMDRGDHHDLVGLVVGYVVHHPEGESMDSNGNVYTNGDMIGIGGPYPNDHVLRHCYPIIKVMEGWKNTPIGGREWGEGDRLPKPVRDFIGMIEKLTGFEVMAIGNGPESDDMIYVERGKRRE